MKIETLLFVFIVALAVISCISICKDSNSKKEYKEQLDRIEICVNNLVAERNKCVEELKKCNEDNGRTDR